MDLDAMDISGQPHRYPPNLSGIPTELQLRIVDYVTTKADLRSLCLTSSALRLLAIPLLYRRIKLELYSPEAIEKLRECNLHGAGPHFQHTKELIIEDECVYEPLLSIHKGRIRIPEAIPREWDNRAPDWEIEQFETQQDGNAYLFLQFMHHHKLERFCYLSQRLVPQMVKSHLRNYQNNIQDLKISLYTDPGSSVMLPRVFCGLQRLDIYHNDHTDIALLFNNIESVGASLKRLSLTAADADTLNGQLDAWADGEPNDLTRYTPMLEELRLANFVVSSTVGALDRVIDFYKLNRLELLVDKGGVLDFVLELAERAQGNRFKLKHIALEFMRGTVLTEDHLMSMMTLFSYCEPIESLHLRLGGTEGFPPRFFDVFEALPHNLQSLSISYDADTTTAVATHRQILLNTLPRSTLNGIKQLAYQFDERDLIDVESHGNSFINLVNSLRGFQQLRLLHIRVEDNTLMGKSPIYDDIPQEEVLMDPHILALQMQTFANLLFEEMHRDGQSKLDALVVGHATSAEEASELQQQCFVRGEQRDILGRTVPVGVPVSQAMLRDTQPHTDILDIDFPRTMSSTGFDGWAGEAF